MDAVFLTGQLFNGFSVASLYILAALGLALSFGLMRVINMAHGEILMVGSYLAYLTIQYVPGPLGLLAAMLVALVGAGLLGAILEVGLISKLTARPLDTLLATWGVSLILQQAARDIFGATGVSVTAPAWLDGGIDLFGLQLPTTRIFIMVVAALVLAGLAATLRFTRIGLLVRAVNQDRPTAAAMGVNVRLVDASSSRWVPGSRASAAWCWPCSARSRPMSGRATSSPPSSSSSWAASAASSAPPSRR